MATEKSTLQDPQGKLTPAERERVIGQLDTALQHALSCGTLLSHVEGLRPERRAELLDRLLDLRSGGRRWSELPERTPEGRERD